MRLSTKQTAALRFFASCLGWRRYVDSNICVRSVKALVRRGLVQEKKVPLKREPGSSVYMWRATALGRAAAQMKAVSR